jgi:hypothetical protein
MCVPGVAKNLVIPQVLKHMPKLTQNINLLYVKYVMKASLFVMFLKFIYRNTQDRSLMNAHCVVRALVIL